MAKTLQDILNDPQNYGDALSIKFGDTDVTLGELRNMRKAERDQVTAEAQRLDGERQKLTAQQNEVLRLSAEAQRIHDDLQQRASAPPPNQTRDDFDDPFWQPVSKKMSALQEKYDKAVEKLNAATERMETQMKNQATIWADDRWDNEYQGLIGTLPEEKRSKVPERDKILKFALDNKIVDRHNIPSIRSAYQKMTEADREKELAERARQEGIEEGKRIALAGRIPQPSTVRAGGGSAPQLNDWNDLTDAALADPEINRLVRQMEAGRSA